MPQCAVATCKNSQRTKKSDPNLSFHRFPKKTGLSKLWVKKCKRKDKLNLQYAMICSSHFSDDQFLDDKVNRVLNLKQRKILNSTAIPNLNLPFQSNKKVDEKRSNRLNIRNKLKEEQARKSKMLLPLKAHKRSVSAPIKLPSQAHTQDQLQVKPSQQWQPPAQEIVPNNAAARLPTSSIVAHNQLRLSPLQRPSPSTYKIITSPSSVAHGLQSSPSHRLSAPKILLTAPYWSASSSSVTNRFLTSPQELPAPKIVLNAPFVPASTTSVTHRLLSSPRKHSSAPKVVLSAPYISVSSTPAANRHLTPAQRRAAPKILLTTPHLFASPTSVAQRQINLRLNLPQGGLLLSASQIYKVNKFKCAEERLQSCSDQGQRVNPPLGVPEEHQPPYCFTRKAKPQILQLLEGFVAYLQQKLHTIAFNWSYGLTVDREQQNYVLNIYELQSTSLGISLPRSIQMFQDGKIKIMLETQDRTLSYAEHMPVDSQNDLSELIDRVSRSYACSGFKSYADAGLQSSAIPRNKMWFADKCSRIVEIKDVHPTADSGAHKICGKCNLILKSLSQTQNVRYVQKHKMPEDQVGKPSHNHYSFDKIQV